jgi:hypothetical protein
MESSEQMEEQPKTPSLTTSQSPTDETRPEYLGRTTESVLLRAGY